MEKTSSEFAKKIMEGLRLAAQKLVEEARRNGQPLVVNVEGRPKLIYP
jgi:hypothetical protein